MSYLDYTGTGILALAAAVPRRIIDNASYTEHFPAEDVAEIVEKIGVKQRRFADDSTCASDLCFAAAEKLIADMQVDRSEIDLLLFVSQTPDYRMPATSIILQHRLGLSDTTIAFDINIGCSGFLYGLSIAYALLQQKGLRKALVLDGETRSKVYSPKDRKTAFLFGDAGVAALIGKGEKFGESFFSIHSDGSRADLIKINGGGYRNPSSPETLKEKVVDEYGNIRSDEHGYMNGGDVFNFLIREVPKDIKGLLEHAGVDLDSIGYYVFHQANSYMNGYLAKKLKLDLAKVPMCIEKYGNTSSVSIPLTMVSELQSELAGRNRLMLCGFGVGLSWGTAVLDVDGCHVSDIVEL
jgi:3-oxoacyl-[acyl-carrier-protein] synthase-3